MSRPSTPPPSAGGANAAPPVTPPPTDTATAAAPPPAASTVTPPPAASAVTAPPAARGRRRRLLGGLALVVLVVGGAVLAWDELVAGRHESTDNAYVQGHVVQITPQVPGTVAEIAAEDTDRVSAGQVLARLDPRDARLALAEAEAGLAQTVREVSTLYGDNVTLAAQIRAREADVARAEAEAERLRGDLGRRRQLAKSGAISKEELTHSEAELTAADSAAKAAAAAVAAAREQLVTSRLLTANTTPAEHPQVLAAAARVRNATLALERTEIRAPVDGYVAQRTAQLGQRAQPGTPLMTVIPLADVWVDANFKESQLADMRIGQPVELLADTYGKDVTYHGTVEGLGAGTGSAFALLPAQNATGNWIKVVQRVPVRIRLEPAALAEHPLRVGLSMEATVDIEDTGGRRLADAPRANASETLGSAWSGTDSAATDAAVQAIIATNLEPYAASARVRGASGDGTGGDVTGGDVTGGGADAPDRGAAVALDDTPRRAGD